MTDDGLEPQLARQDGGFIDVRGTRTHYHEAGHGRPLVMLHGSGPGVTAWANWRLTLPYQAERGFHCYAYDIAGFGYTERDPNVHYGITEWVEHLAAFLEDVVGGPAMLLGNSMGGALALRLAVERPDLVTRLGLMGAAGVRFELTPSLDAVWGYTPSVEHMRTLIAEHFAYDPALATDDLVKLRYEASIQPGFQEAYAALFPAPRQRWVDAIATPDDRLRTIAVPTLLFHGREDRVIPLAVSYRLLELIDRAQLHVFGRCGHWTQVEHAAAFNALCALFFGADA